MNFNGRGTKLLEMYSSMVERVGNIKNNFNNFKMLKITNITKIIKIKQLKVVFSILKLNFFFF